MVILGHTIEEVTRASGEKTWKPTRLVQERGYASVAFLMLGLRIERARAFYEKALEEHPEYRALDVSFVPAEDVLRERYADHPELFKKIMDEFENSEGFRKTDEDERGGTDAARGNAYKGKGHY